MVKLRTSGCPAALPLTSAVSFLQVQVQTSQVLVSSLSPLPALIYMNKQYLYLINLDIFFFLMLG